MKHQYDSAAQHRKAIGLHQHNHTHQRTKRTNSHDQAGLTLQQILILGILAMMLTADIAEAGKKRELGFHFVMGENLSEKEKRNCHKLKTNVVSLRARMKHVDQAISLGKEALKIKGSLNS